MADIVLDGFSEGLVPRQREFIVEVLEKHGYKGAKVTLERVGKLGDNFAADVRRIIAEKNGKTLKIIVKVATVIPELRAAMSTEIIFNNEYLMYTTVLPKFTELETAADVPEGERLKYAKCYGGLVGEPCEVILLEDLAVEGYTMMDKFKSLSNDAVKLVLKNLANLHSLSFALKNQEPVTFETIKGKLFNMWANMLKMDPTMSYFQNMEKELLQILVEEKFQSQLKGRLHRLPELLSKAFTDDDDSKYYVLLQGDCWTNNLLFLEEEQKPTASCMIDYQMSAASSAAADLGYMIFNCTDHETRKKHYHDWLDYYYTELDNYLKYYNLKAEIVYPKERLNNDMLRNATISLTQCVLVASIILRESTDAAKVKKAMTEVKEGDNVMDNFEEAVSVKTMNTETFVKFKSRVEQLIDSHIELGLL